MVGSNLFSGRGQKCVFRPFSSKIRPSQPRNPAFGGVALSACCVKSFLPTMRSWSFAKMAQIAANRMWKGAVLNGGFPSLVGWASSGLKQELERRRYAATWNSQPAQSALAIGQSIGLSKSGKRIKAAFPLPVQNKQWGNSLKIRR